MGRAVSMSGAALEAFGAVSGGAAGRVAAVCANTAVLNITPTTVAPIACDNPIVLSFELILSFEQPTRWFAKNLRRKLMR
jgi:hypothetical protein